MFENHQKFIIYVCSANVYNRVQLDHSKAFEDALWVKENKIRSRLVKARR